MELKNKVALITGASRGIGRGIAEKFASQGANVALHFGRNTDAASEALHALDQRGNHHAFQHDLSKPNHVPTLVKNVLDKYGRIDILVNNAGVYQRHPVGSMKFEKWAESWMETLNVNLISAAYLCHQVAQVMLKEEAGTIINITSRGAFRGEPFHTAYGAAKSGLNSVSQSLAQELGPSNIYVYAIAPGFVETDMADPYLNGPEGQHIINQSPLKRAARPSEIAELAYFMASGKSPYLTGAIVDVNGASYLRN